MVLWFEDNPMQEQSDAKGTQVGLSLVDDNVAWLLIAALWLGLNARLSSDVRLERNFRRFKSGPTEDATD